MNLSADIIYKPNSEKISHILFGINYISPWSENGHRQMATVKLSTSNTGPKFENGS